MESQGSIFERGPSIQSTALGRSRMVVVLTENAKQLSKVYTFIFGVRNTHLFRTSAYTATVSRFFERSGETCNQIYGYVLDLNQISRPDKPELTRAAGSYSFEAYRIGLQRRALVVPWCLMVSIPTSWLRTVRSIWRPRTISTGLICSSLSGPM